MGRQAASEATATTESSALISLSELMSLEKKRLEEERRAAQRRAEEEQVRLRATQDQERRQLEQRAREEREATRVREQKEAEHRAELAGRMLGFIIRAQKEAESQALLASREIDLAHERDLARLRRDKTLRRLRLGLGGAIAGTLLLVATSLGTYATIVRPAHERSLAALQQRVEHAEADADSLRRSLAESKSKRDTALERAVTLAQEMRTLRGELEKLRAAAGQPQRPSRPGRPTSASSDEAAPGPSWDEGDPMAPLSPR